MSPEQMVEDEVLAEEEVVEEEVVEEEETTTRKRRILSDENVYVFPVSKEDRAKGDEHLAKIRKEAKDATNALVYTDGEAVEGFRVWDIVKGRVTNDEGEVTEEGELQACVLARGSAYAMEFFLQDKGYEADLAFKKKKRGRLSKIDSTLLAFGRMLGDILFVDGNPTKAFKPDAPEVHKQSWNDNYARGAKCGHYYDENGNWKEAGV